jgi:hypothetical protein
VHFLDGLWWKRERLDVLVNTSTLGAPVLLQLVVQAISINREIQSISSLLHRYPRPSAYLNQMVS